MMNPGQQIPKARPASSRLPLKLAALFAISFGLFFVLFMAYDLLSGYAERSAMAVQANEQTKPIVIDPKLSEDLAKVLAFDPNSNTEEVRDAFTDRGGLSGTVAAGTLYTPQSGSVTTNVPASTAPSVVSPGTRPSSSGQVPSGTNLVPAAPLVSAKEATKQRYESWLERAATNGDATLDPRVFAIEDLLPVGIVDGGSGQQEVMFFSEAAGKTLSFPVGTMFFDGMLAELRPEGVVFSFNDVGRTIRMRSWARSIKNNG
jgi:hypothetical protein